MATIGRNGKAWRARIRRAGFPDLQANFPTKQQAKMWANKKEADIDQAKVFGKEQLELPPKLQRNVEPTIDQVILSYRQLHTSGKKEMNDSKFKTLGLSMRELRGIKISELTTDTMYGYADDRLSRVSASTLKKQCLAIGQAIRWSRKTVYRKVIKNDPWPDVMEFLTEEGMIGQSEERDRRLYKTPPVFAKLPKNFKGTEENLLLNTCLNTWGKLDWIYWMVRIAITSAMREGEIHRMQWSLLDLDKDVQVIKARKDPKRPKDQHVPITPELKKALLEYRQICRPGDYLFTEIEKTASIGQRFKNLTDRLSYPAKELTFHDLRHEAISRLFERKPKLSIPEVAKISGHKTWSQLKRYTHLQAEDVAKKMK